MRSRTANEGDCLPCDLLGRSAIGYLNRGGDHGIAVSALPEKVHQQLQHEPASCRRAEPGRNDRHGVAERQHLRILDRVEAPDRYLRWQRLGHLHSPTKRPEIAMHKPCQIVSHPLGSSSAQIELHRRQSASVLSLSGGQEAKAIRYPYIRAPSPACPRSRSTLPPSDARSFR